MKFLEKDLETLIWENTETCYERGLAIRRIGKYMGDCRFRQLNLGPYGIADLVNTRYYPEENSLFIQVIECKKDEINLNTYAQAKRYLTAIKEVVQHHYGITEGESYVSQEMILIGRKFETSGDFPFVYNEDSDCHAYTYEYGIDGLRFTLVQRHWAKNIKESGAALAAFTTAFSNEVTGTTRYEEQARHTALLAMLANGDTSCPLLVTSSGVLVNTALFNRFNEYGY